MGSAKDSFEQIKDHGAYPSPVSVDASEELKLFDSDSGETKSPTATEAACRSTNPR